MLVYKNTAALALASLILLMGYARDYALAGGYDMRSPWALYKHVGTRSRSRAAASRAAKSARSGIVRRGRGFLRTAGYWRGRRSGAGGELKFLDTNSAAAISAIIGTVHSSSLVTIPQDGTESGRVGRKVTVKSLHVRGLCVLAGTSDFNNTDDTVRLMIVLDKQCNGTAATPADILEAGAGTVTIDSFNNLANKSRFRVLKDTKICMNLNGAVDSVNNVVAGNRTVPFEYHFSNLNLPIEYDNSATTGALATVRSNNLLVLGISSDQRATIRYTARVRYSD